MIWPANQKMQTNKTFILDTIITGIVLAIAWVIVVFGAVMILAGGRKLFG